MLNRLLARRLERLGATRRDLPVRGGALRIFEVEGQGALPTVVMVHGLGARAAAYAPVVAALRPHVQRVIVPDLPGHGESVWDQPVSAAVLREAVLEALPRIAPEGAALFGNSLGGYGALWVAGRAPELVRGVMVTSPGGGPLPDDEREVVLSRFRPATHADALDLVDRSLTGLRGPSRHLIAWVARRNLAQPGVKQVLDQLDRSDDLQPDDLARLQMPVQVWWGTAEHAFSPRQLDWFAAHLPAHATLHRPEGWGHAAFRERPAEVGDALVAFLRGL